MPVRAFGRDERQPSHRPPVFGSDLSDQNRMTDGDRAVGRNLATATREFLAERPAKGCVNVSRIGCDGFTDHVGG